MQAHKTFKPQLETLETRQLMAGNVDVRVSGGDLVITGDHRSNGVQVTQVGAGQYRVQGTNQEGATTINGKAYQIFSNVKHDIRADLKAGNDYLDVRGAAQHLPLQVPRDLKVDGGSGNDVVALYDLKARDVEINTRDGHDQAVFVRNQVTRNMKIDTGDHDDYVYGYQSTVKGDLTVKTGSGNDYVSLYQVTADRFFSELGHGNDTLYAHYNKANYVKIDGGAGYDTLDEGNNTVKTVKDTNFEKFI